MINKTDFYNWQNSTLLDRQRFGGKESPNILAVKEYVLKRFGGSSVSTVNKRHVRDGSVLSSHYFGAAWDWGYATRSSAVKGIDFLVANSGELGIQLITDYVGCRVWSSTGGWRDATVSDNGMGKEWAKWVHVETTKSQWGNNMPVEQRLP